MSQLRRVEEQEHVQERLDAAKYALELERLRNRPVPNIKDGSAVGHSAANAAEMYRFLRHCESQPKPDLSPYTRALARGAAKNKH